MRNIALILSYDGSELGGWQRQKNRPTVQAIVERALRELLQEEVSLLASGRTDAGVHALGQVANFRTSTRRSCHTIWRALNAHLPPSIRCRHVCEVPLAFHATYDARRKLYRYVFQDSPVPLPMLRHYTARSIYRLNVADMARAARALLGRHDFAAFQTRGAPRASTVRTVTRCTVCRASARWLFEDRAIPDEGVGAERGDLVFIEVAADGFLYNMVRAIAGTLYNVGRGYWPVEAVREILESRDRRRAGPTAPPQGLYLVKVWYGIEQLDGWSQS